MNINDAADYVDMIILEALLKVGGVTPSLFVVGTERVALVTMVNFGGTDSLRSNQLFALGKELREQNKNNTAIGNLEYVVLATEGWVSQTHDPEQVKTLVPADDPEHVEAVFVVAYRPHDGKALMHIHEIMRTEGGEIRDTVPYPIPDDVQFEVNALDAFAAGYFGNISN